MSDLDVICDAAAASLLGAVVAQAVRDASMVGKPDGNAWPKGSSPAEARRFLETLPPRLRDACLARVGKPKHKPEGALMAKRKVESARTFRGNEDWSGMNAAVEWAQRNGYSVGPMERDKPRAMFLGDVHVAGWRSLSDKQKARVDGVMVAAEGWRNGVIVVEIYAANGGGR